MNIDSIKRDLLVKFPEFGDIINNSNFVVDTNVGSVATDGKDIYYNPDFINSISTEQQRFAFANALLHIASNNIVSAEGKDQILWNVATDAVINAMLRQEGFSDIQNSVNIPDAINYSAEEMYSKLLEEKNKRSINPEDWDGKRYTELVGEFTQSSDQNKKK